ncbi:MAG: Unknown protein [uncultured Sulfurovum sp.]|uniref:Uncharacterized protein n=1 Tax=uncultured Sulfurovum sp. TaxID=269237 RepID=A0A6S6U4T9_9BACT|nr:MAG: Unknown protein [uncultured Sulfurovum sp.]
MKKILIGIVFLLNFSFAETITLQKGWNLVGINAPLSLEELKTQIGLENLLVIQGKTKTYQKHYVDNGTAFLNDFEAFETGKGYWVQVDSATTLNYTEVENQTSSYTKVLEEGWNLINAPVEITLSELIAQIGEENLLLIQGANQTYQRAYALGGNAQLNDLKSLSSTGAYWVQVASSVDLEFVFNMDKLAVDNLGNALVKNMEIDGQDYTVKVYTNVIPSEETSFSTIAISGTINGVNTTSTFKLNATYALTSNFMVKVFNAQNEEVAKSNHVKYLTSPINFAAITFEVESSDEVEEVRNAQFQGVNVFSTALSFNDYGLESMSDSDFNDLSIENKRLLASKLLSVLFYGLPKTDLDILINSGTFISTIQAKLATPNTDLKSTEENIEDKDYNWSERNENREKILARLFKLGIGKEYFNRWAAYVLTQNIMFSPANELETVDASEILNVYNRLVMLMDDDYSIQMITYLHMTSDDNWKRFRSPEDNGREMLEIFLLDFDDAHVPKAGIALQNWRLNRSDNELVIGLNQNDVPQELFGTTVTTGFDFYRELVKSDDFTKGVTSRLVERYFSERSAAKKAEMITLIVDSNPDSFKDILLQIVFSKEFLLHTSKVKTIEEATFPIMKAISFFDRLNFFPYLREYMDNMHQSPLSYKLGRDNSVPVDTLSFAYYYYFLRQYVMTDTQSNVLNEWDGGWKLEFIDKSIANTSTVKGLINHVFLSVVAREATQEELLLLSNYAINEARGTYDDMNTYNDREGVTQIVMEYLSRLTEIYTFKKIEE